MKRYVEIREPLGQTEVTIHGQSYGATPDERGPLGGGPGYVSPVISGDYQVGTLEELIEALAQAQSGQVVFVNGSAEIDCTVRIYVESLVLEIPAGVTLASDRGHDGAPGALILSDTFNTSPLCRCLGPDVRVTGLRLHGPDPERRLDLHALCVQRATALESPRGFDHEYYYLFPNSEGIRTAFSGLEVDNCELAGWSLAAIYPISGDRHHIHHNYIHHNQRNGLGYGVCLGDGRVEARIERNLFNANRHSIAATGAPGTRYEASHNVELGLSLSHCFDMHGGSDRGDGTNIAGTWMHVHHNTFRSEERPIAICGVPEEEALIERNWFLHHLPETHDMSRAAVYTGGRTRIVDNAYGVGDPQVLDMAMHDA